MTATTEWCGWSGTVYSALIYGLRDACPADSPASVCLGIERSSVGASKIIAGPALLTEAGRSAFVGRADKKGATEIHVVAASSASQAAAILDDLKPE